MIAAFTVISLLIGIILLTSTILLVFMIVTDIVFAVLEKLIDRLIVFYKKYKREG